MKKTLWLISLFLTASQAAETSSSGPRDIIPRGQSYLRTSDSSNSISGTHLTVFSTKKGTCTYSTSTSSNLDDILQSAKELEDPEILIHQSVFLKQICKTPPNPTIGLIWDVLPNKTSSELSKLNIKTDKFKNIHNLGEIDSNTVTIVIITALSTEDNTELLNRFKEELKVSQLTGKNFILANIPQDFIATPRSVQLPRRNQPADTPPRQIKSADTSPRSHTPEGGIFEMDF